MTTVVTTSTRMEEGPPTVVQAAPVSVVTEAHTATSGTTSVVIKDDFGTIHKSIFQGVLIVGIVTLVFGALSVILGIIAIVTDSKLYGSGVGIWIGLLFYVTTGAIGIKAGLAKTRSCLTTFMILSIITVSIGCFIMMAVTAAGVDQSNGYCDFFFFNCNNGNGLTTSLAVNSAMLGLTFAVAVLCIVGSAMACHVTCCSRGPGAMVVQVRGRPIATRTTTISAHSQPVPMHQSQVVPQYGQTMMYTTPVQQPPPHMMMYNQAPPPVGYGYAPPPQGYQQHPPPSGPSTQPQYVADQPPAYSNQPPVTHGYSPPPARDTQPTPVDDVPPPFQKY